MPELPEVETIRRGLQRFIIGYRINRVEVREPRLRWPIDVERLKQMAQSKTVLDIGRRAKYLLIHLQEDTTLVIHLGMSGNLLLINTPVPLEKHDHVSFYFVNGAELRYRDPRRFGMIDVTQTSELGQYERLKNLGAEPLSPSTRAWDLYQKAQTTNRAIKILLMDSHFIVGV
ncbi:MAG: DNA-formamidopyrimidine glycosylase, partial [Calditrichaeota bacterium]